MNHFAPNLNPYGAWYMTPGGLPSPVADPGPAIARARAKLKRLREHPQTEQPLRGQTKLLRIAAFALVIAGTPVLVAWAIFGRTAFLEWWLYLVMILPVLVVAPQAVWSHVQTHTRLFARSPEVVLRQFLEPLRSRTLGAANSFTVSCDNDDSVRFAPRLPGMARTNRYRMSDDQSRRAYWSDAMFDGANWQYLHLSEMRSAPLTADLTVVEARVAVVVHGRSPFVESLLSGLFVPIALVGAVPILSMDGWDHMRVIMLGILAIPVAIALGFHIYKWSGGHAHQFRLRKLMVRVHDEWRVFNGELQGPEEGDLSWLLQPDQKE